MTRRYSVLAIAISLFALASTSLAQTIDPRSQGVNAKMKIEIGMSPDEVKKAIGKPAAVEGGFPEDDEGSLVGMPKMVGQLNQSTWFYMYSPFETTVEVPGGFACTVNGRRVSKTVFDSYQGQRKVYILDGQIIEPSMGRGYELLRNPGLRTEELDPGRTWSAARKKKTATRNVIPVLCVIFDKGTQVVAATKLYYMTRN